MRRLLLLSAAALTSLWAPTPAYAWNKHGHMVAAYIAYETLKHDDPALLARLVAKFDDIPRHDLLLATLTHQDADTDLNKFLAMATWPDAIKPNPFTHKVSPIDTTNRAYPKSHEGWHYVNYPLQRGSTPGTPQMPPGENGVTQVQDQVGKIFKDGTNAAEQAEALCWVEHVVGDLHQPLHCVALIDPDSDFDPPEGDRGGNSIKVDTDDKELHAVWDNLLGTGQSVSSVVHLGKQLMQQHPKTGFTQPLGAKPEAWAAESYALAGSTVYSILPSHGELETITVEITPAYEKDAHRVAEEQIVLAGYRMAAYLKAHAH